MRVAIIQSNYLPWRGYFDVIDDVDTFVFLDNVQYTDRDWRNRNRIKTASGLSWLSVSLKKDDRAALVEQKVIDWELDWPKRHLNLLRQNYQTAPFYEVFASEFEAILSARPRTLSELNASLVSWIKGHLGIDTPILHASSLPCEGEKTERLLSILKSLGASVYLSGPSAAGYLDLEAFRHAGIGLEYKSYDYAPYPQLWGDFEGGVSVLDLLMNAGPDARDHLKSQSPNEIVL